MVSPIWNRRKYKSDSPNILSYQQKTPNTYPINKISKPYIYILSPCGSSPCCAISYPLVGCVKTTRLKIRRLLRMIHNRLLRPLAHSIRLETRLRRHGMRKRLRPPGPATGRLSTGIRIMSQAWMVSELARGRSSAHLARLVGRFGVSVLEEIGFGRGVLVEAVDDLRVS